MADADAVLNFAAESHVDRSILDPEAFLRTGVIGVHVLLDACRREAAGWPPASGARRPVIRGLRRATSRSAPTRSTARSRPASRSRAIALAPRSPYAASKAAGELLVRSYVVTHGIDALVTRGSNTYGPYHHPEKLIPLFITNALEDQPLPLYGDGLQQRDWLYVSDHAGAIDWVLRHGRSGETYNIPGSAEMTNRAVVALLLEILDKPWSLVRTVEDRPGHDRRYALDGRHAWPPSAGATRSSSPTACAGPSTGSGPTKPGGGRSRPATGTPTTSGSTAGAWLAPSRPALIRPGRRRPPPTRPARPRQTEMRVAVSGTGGRLGRAVLAAFAEAPFTGIAGPIAWHRPDYDLDDPGAAARLIARDRPEVIVHAAAWTDVDGCARDPETALRRNGEAVGHLARAAAGAGLDLVLVSTNEVFDGRRTDGRGYRPDDPPNPINAYGASKLAGEQAARAAFASAGLGGPGDRPDGLALRTTRQRLSREDRPGVRASPDRPAKRSGWSATRSGSPTFTRDLAEGIVDLIGSGEPIGGIHHIVNGGAATRAAWARAVVAGLDIEVPFEEVPGSTWVRASTPPAWAVLEPTALPSGEPLRTWQLALADYLPVLRGQLAGSLA